MDHARAHHELIDIKETIKKYLNAKGLANLLPVFPDDPSELDSSVLKWPKGEEPSQEWRKFPFVSTIYIDMAMRGNNKKLKPLGSNKGLQAPVPSQELQVLRRMAHEVSTMGSRPIDSAGGLLNLKIFKPTRKALAIGDGSVQDVKKVP